ncbi:GEM-like protein 5 [Ananas comosus]|uniref:GEM-like protein 5 n=1 Tax=Ananas comosus TaxID=4615 RepID=A0A199UQJ8_ANACO|nr:GEM-like protein 5 [Ananas comosus]OAY67029.1 GEM-like protein 5 [Ananas comosus]
MDPKNTATTGGAAPTPSPPPPATSGGGGGETTVPSAMWGTRQMGQPAAPTAHPGNQEAAAGQWRPRAADEEAPPYVLERQPVAHKPNASPMEHILDFFNSWTTKAEELASSIWLNLKTAPSKSEAALGKLSLTAKALTEGGFESLYKQTFPADPSERLKKTFACYLSTTTGPVAGTLYLSTHNLAFCSDRPLSFTAPSGQLAWSYYKVLIPLSKIAKVNPVTLKENPPERYVQVVTVDGHEFWFMGFISYEKAVKHLLDAASGSAAAAAQRSSPQPAVH